MKFVAPSRVSCSAAAAKRYLVPRSAQAPSSAIPQRCTVASVPANTNPVVTNIAVIANHGAKSMIRSRMMLLLVAALNISLLLFHICKSNAFRILPLQSIRMPPLAFHSPKVKG
jgi:hypothetical protein